jgi:hypothetical protein
MDNAQIRFVLALGDDAATIEAAAGTAVVERLPSVVLVQADTYRAKELAGAGEYVHVFSSPHDALRALNLFRHAS